MGDASCCDCPVGLGDEVGDDAVAGREIDAPSPVVRGAAADVRDLKSARFYIV